MQRAITHRFLPIFRVALSLSGCVGKSAVPAAEPTAAEEARRMADAEGPPKWNVGDAWTYRFDAAGYEGTVAIAVTSLGDEGYGLAVSNKDFAFVSARYHLPFHQNWSLDLATISGPSGEPVKLFDWPLTVGKTWTTSWLGKEGTATVENIIAGNVTRYKLALVSDDEAVLKYEYAPAFGALFHLEALVSDLMDSAPQTVVLDLQGPEPDNSTTYWRASVHGSSSIRDLGAQVQEQFQVDEDPAGFWLPYAIEGYGTVMWRAERNGSYHPPGRFLTFGSGGNPGNWAPATAGNWSWTVEARGTSTLKLGAYLVEWSAAAVETVKVKG